MKTKRRGWLLGPMIAAVMAVALLAAACAAEKEIVTVVETVIVMEKVPAEAIIKEVVVVATPVPLGEQQWMLAAISPAARKGGHFIKSNHGPPSHFDLFATGTIANTGSQGPMYDLLIRHDPRDASVPIVPDLAHRWEISSDGLTYTFHLREGVKWHDGTDFSSADVKATYDRIAFPKEGLVSLRKTLFTSLERVEAPDPLTVKFVLNESRSSDFMLQTFSVGYNMIVTKAILDETDGNLRETDNHPGTGPFKYVSRDTEKWVLERNEDYWNPNVPYVDKITHVWMIAWTPELAAAILGGVVDWTQWLDPKTFEKIKTIEGMSTLELIVPSINGFGFNTERAPLDDVRVRMAISLVVDKPALAEAMNEVKATFFSGWFMPGTVYARSRESLLVTENYRSPTDADIAKAKQLLADAGFPDGKGFPELDYAVRETPDQRIMSAAIQAMTLEHLNIKMKITIHQASAIAQVSQGGEFDVIGAGAGSRIPDPSTYLPQAFGQCGDTRCDQNATRYNNPEFDRIGREFIRETDSEKRIALGAELRDILERDVPAFPFGSTSVQWGWYNYLKGVTPGSMSGGYDVYKWDHVWLDEAHRGPR